VLNALKLRIRMDFPNLIVNTLIYSGGAWTVLSNYW